MHPHELADVNNDAKIVRTTTHGLCADGDQVRLSARTMRYNLPMIGRSVVCPSGVRLRSVSSDSNRLQVKLARMDVICSPWQSQHLCVA